MPKASRSNQLISTPNKASAVTPPVETPTVPFMYTGFQPLSTINGKNVASSFAKSEHQSWWTRRADDATWEGQRHWKKAVMLGDRSDDNNSDSAMNKRVATVQDNRSDELYSSQNHSKLIDPLSRQQATITDPAKRTIVIHPGSTTLRIGRASDPAPISIPNVVARRRPQSGKRGTQAGVFRRMEPRSTPEALETFTSKINAIRVELKTRMRQLKLRGITNGTGIAANYNAEVTPLVLSDDQDPLDTSWPPVTGPQSREIYIGEDALLIAEAEKNGYAVRWPLKRGYLNNSEESGYESRNEILADIEAVWSYALSHHLGVKELELKEYSAIFILPDLYDHIYLREMTDLMFRGLGFKQICIQQESLCACFGAGLGTACVIDVGASKTSISCVEEGWVIPDSRLQLSIGGDDITVVLSGMLRKQNFPYKELDLNVTWEWQMMEQLKEDMLVLSEGDVGLNTYSFFVRHPGRATTKWNVRAYDEVIIPAMIMFSPSIVEFDRKFKPGRSLFADRDSVDDVLDLGGNVITEAMRNATGIPVYTKPASVVPSINPNGSTTEVNRPNPPSVAEESLPAAGNDDYASPYNGTPQPVGNVIDSNAPTRRSSPTVVGPKPAPVATLVQPSSEPVLTPHSAFTAALSKVPLHEAIVHSLLACGPEERCKRMTGAIMIVGGGGLIHNIGYAITSRIQPMLKARYPNIEACTTIPPPRDIDPRILAWKGVSMLCRLESASDLWIRSSDWEVLGSKAIKDRAMFI
ncbi:hypothetical protein BY996DRAFT_6422092 [Phakopsora pachyrhizi]|nr:hypothetical protein BY996DRAFT_6422092 [Phakopsora pachyrhizi]